MVFQFQCPQGHLLQGDSAHMGMQTQCPYCGVAFLIPVVELPGMHPGYTPQYAQPYTQPYGPQEAVVPESIFEAPQPGVRDFLEQVAAEQGTSAPAEQAVGIDIHAVNEPAPVGCVHIPCPNGHELETPYDMLGQEVLCPHCNAQFRLRNEDSREYKEKQAQREYEQAKAWVNWAITAAVLVGGGLLVLMAIAMSK